MQPIMKHALISAIIFFSMQAADDSERNRPMKQEEAPAKWVRCGNRWDRKQETCALEDALHSRLKLLDLDEELMPFAIKIIAVIIANQGVEPQHIAAGIKSATNEHIDEIFEQRKPYVTCLCEQEWIVTHRARIFETLLEEQQAVLPELSKRGIYHPSQLRYSCDAHSIRRSIQALIH